MTEPFLRARHRGPDEKVVDYPPLPDPLVVPVYDNPTHLEIEDGDEVGNVIRDEPEHFLAGPEGGFRQLALGDILEDEDHTGDFAAGAANRGRPAQHGVFRAVAGDEQHGLERAGRDTDVKEGGGTPCHR